ncbi:putative membrane protein [Fuerstiella marisgermanici]|uniref:Putative membrane protein n=1 Tax=Fuerstiella marisgermanici TaxID=1891926 RepID=A0A1P8WPH3_9PLAN|nr:putative membrane protein [Fuerstiella marisgermanici]
MEISQKISRGERRKVLGLFWTGFTVRVSLLLLLHFSGVERSLRLTKDAFLYDSLGRQIADYYRSSGKTAWPSRVTGVIDHLYEHVVGIIYYMSGDSMMAVRLINALAGSLVILCVWRMARYITDPKTALRCATWACYFPTQLYYSCLPVRDSHSTLAMAMIFLGMTAIASGGRGRHVAALPIGLVLTAGYRGYVAGVLLFLVPASWLVSFLVVKSRNKSKFVQRIVVLSFLFVPIMASVGVEKVFTTGKAAQMTDLDYWNSTRVKMNRGSGAVYNSDIPEIGKNVVDTVTGVAIGIYFFFVSLNPSEMDSVRQWMAIPEVAIVLYMIPKMYRGFRRILKYHRFQCFSLLFVAFAITFAYSSVTTNAGPLMRWRLQVANVYILIAAIGYAKNYTPELLRKSAGRVQPAEQHWQALTPAGTEVRT